MTVIRSDREGSNERELGDAARLNGLLQRAGVGVSERATSSDSSLGINNNTTQGARAVTSDAVVKVQAKVDELQLGPVVAPRVDFTAKLSESARSFAQNVDRALTNHLTQSASALTAQHGELAVGNNPRLQLATREGGETHQQGQRQLGTVEQQRAAANEDVLARLLPNQELAHTALAEDGGLHRPVDDNAAEVEANAEANADANANPDARGVVVNPIAHGLLTAPTTNNAAATGAAKAKAGSGNAVLKLNKDAAHYDAANRVATGSGQVENAMQVSKRLTLLDMTNLSSDQLLAEFLKLNINDPNSNVETQNKLYTLATEMRQLAIEEAKKRIERAQELMKEAQKYADQAQKYADMAGMLGIAAAFLGPLGAILSGIMQIVVAVMQYQAQMMMLDAKEEKNNAERFKLMGDMHQNQVQETAEFINTIMEMKNQMIESVIQMLNASFSTRQQLMSAAMAR